MKNLNVPQSLSVRSRDSGFQAATRIPATDRSSTFEMHKMTR